MFGVLSGNGIRTVSAAIRATPVPLKHAASDRPSLGKRFVTISRQGGAGGHTIGQRLAARLNELDPADPEQEPWTLWDRQLVEKVVAEHHIARELVETIEVSHKSWIQEFMAGFSMENEASEDRVYRRVAMTIRALAQRGRAIIVGRGGVYITRNMPGGVHLRLIAPFEYRVRVMAAQLGLDLRAAGEYVRNIDRQRAAFYRRYWPREALVPEAFTLTVNTAIANEDQVVESVIPLVLQHTHMVPPDMASSESESVPQTP